MTPLTIGSNGISFSLITERNKNKELAFKAMMFARHVHKDQLRKYTNTPYSDHLAEVAGIVATVSNNPLHIAVAWLHDTVEDCGVKIIDLYEMFGSDIAVGVSSLSDLEKGNRAERKRLGRIRLSEAPGWIQTIKCADLISNTPSIVKYDPKFAVTYLEEKRLLLEVLTEADKRLLELAKWQL